MIDEAGLGAVHEELRRRQPNAGLARHRGPKAVLKKRKSVSETEFAAALRQEARRKGLTSRHSA